MRAFHSILGKMIAALVLMAGAVGIADAAESPQSFVHSDKCPFTLGVLDSMKVDPFAGAGNVSNRYRLVETADSVRASFSQQSGDVRVSYSATCTGKDPAQWLSRYGSDQDAACKRLAHYRDSEMQANAYCALTSKDLLKVLLTGTWGKDPKHADAYRERARFTAAQPTVGSISVRVFVSAADSGEARRLAEQLLATLAVKPTASQSQ